MLIVEDEPGIATLMAETLRDEGFEVTHSTSPHAALTVLSALRPDVLLFDYRMEGLDGRAFLEAVRERGIEAPAILCSAWSGGASVAEEMGALWVAKPFDLDTLIAVVRDAAETP